VLDANQESIHAKHAQKDIIYNRLQVKKVYNIFVSHVKIQTVTHVIIHYTKINLLVCVNYASKAIHSMKKLLNVVLFLFQIVNFIGLQVQLDLSNISVKNV
jgi:hypothetical protein